MAILRPKRIKSLTGRERKAIFESNPRTLTATYKLYKSAPLCSSSDHNAVVADLDIQFRDEENVNADTVQSDRRQELN